MNLNQEELCEIATEIIRFESGPYVITEVPTCEYILLKEHGFLGGSVYRVRGQANGSWGEGSKEWSYILKTIPATNSSVSDLKYWKREALAYQSGILGLLRGRRGGLQAPYCFKVCETPEAVTLYLEDVKDGLGEWSWSDYATVARKLGEFNGARVIPYAEHWMSMAASWKYADSKEAAPAAERIKKLPNCFVVNEVFPIEVRERLLSLWERKDGFFASLEGPLNTFCHLDADRRNLFTTKGGALIAADWEFAGWGALGEEIAPLFVVSLVRFQADPGKAKEFAELLFEEYCAGLRSVGCPVYPDLIQYAFKGTCVLRNGFDAALTILKYLVDGKPAWVDLPREELIKGWSSVFSLLSRFAEEVGSEVGKRYTDWRFGLF